MTSGKFGVPTFHVFICALKRAIGQRVQLANVVVFTVCLLCLMMSDAVAAPAPQYLYDYDGNGDVVLRRVGTHRGKTFVGDVDWAATHDERAKGAAHWRARQDLAAKFQGTTGAVSNVAVRGTVTQTVSKRTVMQNLLANARKGGSLIAKGAGFTPGGIVKMIVTEVVLRAAFNLVADKLKEKGYEWSDKDGDFVNPQEYTVECRSIFDGQKYGEDPEKNHGFKPCGGISSYGRNMPDVAKSVYTSICQSQEVENHTFVKAEGDTNGGLCWGTRNNMTNGELFWYVQLRTVLNKNRAITQSEFDDIILPIADKNPTPYVNASGDGEGNIPGVSKPEVYLLPGQIVQSDPYTNPQTGLPEQARWETSDDPSAPGVKSKVKETITPRPDLKPDSPEAPRAKPPQKEKEETDKDKDGKSDNDGKKSRQPSDTKDLCEKHPNILACDPVPKDKQSASEPRFSVPEEVVDLKFSPDTIFPEDGVCPAPVQFEVSIPFSGSKSFALDYQWICSVAVKLRMLLIAVAWLVVAFLVTKSIKQ